MFRKVKADSMPLTPELASQFAGMVALPGERCLRPSRSMYLAAQLMIGKFSGPDWATGYCKADGVTYRLDGQHSSDLLVNLPHGHTFPADLIATITRYEFDSMDDAPDVFDLFNNPRSVRNNADMMGVYKAHVPALAGYSREFLINVANGLHESEYQRRQKGAKDAVLLGARERGVYFAGVAGRPDFLEITHWLANFRELKNAAFLTRPVIVAEMIGHRATAPDLATTFWDLTCTEKHPDPEHETRVLAETFRELLAIAGKPRIDQIVFRKRTRNAWKLFKAAATTIAA
jgi:hypothetical protein